MPSVEIYAHELRPGYVVLPRRVVQSVSRGGIFRRNGLVVRFNGKRYSVHLRRDQRVRVMASEYEF